MSGSHREIPLLMLGGGPLVLAWGLDCLRQKRLIEDTPTSKVRSAAMGLVELSGQAVPRTMLKAPCTGRECCWWYCRVQEYKRSGKNSRWVTVKELGSPELFYLRDSTGRVLVDPQGAELIVPETVIPLDSGTRAQLEPAFAAWGLSSSSWFGFDKKMRVQEQAIIPAAELYVLGDLAKRVDQLEARKQRFAERIRAAKSDPAKMAEADANHDGGVDAMEWTDFLTREESRFLVEEAARAPAAAPDDDLVVRGPADRPFIISTEPESGLTSAFGRRALFGTSGGIAVAALGCWLAQNEGYALGLIIGIVSAGLAVGLLFVKSTRMLRRGGR